MHSSWLCLVSTVVSLGCWSLYTPLVPRAGLLFYTVLGSQEARVTPLCCLWFPLTPTHLQTFKDGHMLHPTQLTLSAFHFCCQPFNSTFPGSRQTHRLPIQSLRGNWGEFRCAHQGRTIALLRHFVVWPLPGFSPGVPEQGEGSVLSLLPSFH